MFDLPSFFGSFLLHAVLISVIVVWNASAEKKPRVEYNFLRANVVVREPPKLLKDKTQAPKPIKKPKVAKKPDKKTEQKPKRPSPKKPKPAKKPAETAAKPKPKAAKSEPPKPEQKQAEKKPDKQPLPDIDLPVISEWSSVLAEEEASLEAASEAIEAQTRALELKAYYVELIRNRVGNYWSRPLSARNGMVVILSVRLLPDGTVHRVIVAQSSGSDAFDRSCLQAVQKAGTLPVPEERDVFNRYFKQFSIQFRPEDLQQ